MTTTTTPPWRGFHHVAVATPDLAATIHFYTHVLGMEAGPILGTSAGTHCFIKPGESESWGLHFFEKPDTKIFTDPGLLNGFVLLPGTMQHIAFALPDEPALQALDGRLQTFGVKTTGLNTIGSIKNILFFDNNGILLEATWPNW